MKRILLACLFSLACGLGAPAAAQGDAPAAAAPPAQDAAAEERRRDIRRLLQTMGAGELGVQMLNQMLPDMRSIIEGLLKELPEAQRQLAVRVMEEETFKTFTAERIVEEIVPIYENLLTGEEIKTLLAFFESPAGRKYISVQPQILRDSSAIGDKLAAESF